MSNNKDLSASTSDDFVGSSTENDELAEARKVAETETARVRLWRFINADVIIMIACIISLSAYSLLRDKEKTAFEESYAEYSFSLEQAVLKGQMDKRNGLRSFAASISSLLAESNQTTSTWPFIEIPAFDTQAQQLKLLSGLEQIIFAQKVDHENREQWISAASEVFGPYSSSAGQQPFISSFDPATEQYTPDIYRKLYFPATAWSPPPTTQEQITWNIASTMQNEAATNALMILGNETLLVPPMVTPMSSELRSLTHMFSPIQTSFENLDRGTKTTQSELVGIVSGGFSWENELKNVLPKGADGIIVVIRSSNCNETYAYEVNGQKSSFKSFDDVHDPHYNEYELEIDLTVYENAIKAQEITGHCQYIMNVYPGRSLELAHRTWFPEIAALILTLSFVLISATFFTYDTLVDRRNEKLVDRFARSNAIVNSLFPRAYRDRLMGDEESQSGQKGAVVQHYRTLKGIMSIGVNQLETEGGSGTKSKPLADIFPDVSVIFADIAGFTAWSSAREPSQVFLLLETLYGSFDEVAKRRCVFKVETIGDCFVAACGLPHPRRDHAVVMVRFANDIMTRMHVLTRELEVKLGPDTSDLRLRIGINSGTVTAGILRGDKARFQLFGDVVNTASRTESLGLPGRIQITQSTADLIIASGRGHWLQKRPDLIAAKGKGLLQTYFVTNISGSKSGASASSGSHQETAANIPSFVTSSSTVEPEQAPRRKIKNVSATKKNEEDRSNRHVEWCVKRQIDWSVEVLLQLIKQIVAHRQNNKENQPPSSQEQNTMNNDVQQETTSLSSTAVQPLDEVKEIISLPEFNPVLATKTTKVEPQHVKIPDPVLHQLRSLVTAIHGRYNSNPFHNFEHANHVTMSVCKLLSRIVSPLDDLPDTDKIASTTESQPPAAEHAASVAAVAAMHDHTYGITSDPLTQFACVFSALIHDVDHPGVSNAQLANESDPLAHTYHNRSIAEQHSLDLSWDLFMDSSFDALRATICSSEAELSRFRQLIVNAVMATDIVDKELKALRNDRWDKAFRNEDPNNGDDHSATGEEEPANIARNRKATIVIEHLIQASDVAHTMQHWHVYRSWNERLFREVYKAYKEGRCANDPSDGWYQGEIGFFDFYIIPLAKKLKDCGVFGVSSDEYLDYALNNREEWVARGHEVVAKISEAAKREFG